MSCPDHATLEALATGSLPPGSAIKVRGHTTGCPECSSAIDAIEAGRAPVKAKDRFGRYLVLGPLGAGGMGRVYRVYDPQLDRKAALKVLLEEGLADPLARERLVREARAMAKLAHPNIVAVFDAGESDGEVFVTMELVEGPSLDRWLAASPRTTSEIVTLFRQAGEGLAAAHRAGLVHRDFKPSNVLVKDGAAKVTDFGLARRAGLTEVTSAGQPDPLSDVVTVAGVLGTPAYMAPEQRQGQVDARSDQYAFGVSLHEALFGARPGQPARSARRVPRWLARIIEQATSADPANRFADFGALLRALENDPAPRRRLFAVTATAAIVAAVSVTGWARHQSQLCGSPQLAARAVFGNVQARALREAFRTRSTPGAARALELTSERVLAVGDEWAAAQQASCEATRLRGEQSDQLYTLKTLCLDRVFDRWASLSRAMGQLEPTMPERELTSAIDAIVGGLPSPASCDDRERLLLQSSGESVDQQRQARPVRQAIDAVYALTASGKSKDAAAALVPIVAQATTLANAALSAEVEAASAHVELRVGTRQAAERHFQQAYRLATTTRLDAVAATALLELLSLEASDARMLEVLRPLAEAAIDRAGRTPLFEATLAYRLGGTYFNLGKYDEAAKEYARAFEIRKRELGLERRETLWAWTNLSAALIRVGRTSEAVEIQRQIVEVSRRAWGDDALTTIEAKGDYAAQLVAARRDPEALPLLEDVIARIEGANASDSNTRYSLFDNYGIALMHLGRYADARPIRDKATALAHAAFGDEATTANARAISADLALCERDPARALQDSTQAVESLTRLNAEHGDLPWALATRAQALAMLGRNAEASAALERASRLADPSADDLKATLELAEACVRRPSERAATAAASALEWFAAKEGYAEEVALARRRLAVARTRPSRPAEACAF